MMKLFVKNIYCSILGLEENKPYLVISKSTFNNQPLYVVKNEKEKYIPVNGEWCEQILEGKGETEIDG